MAVVILEASMISPHKFIESAQVWRKKSVLPSVNLVRVRHHLCYGREVVRSKI